jgi:hypothetical protein
VEVGSLTVQLRVQTLVGHERVHQGPLASVCAVADEAEQIGMPDPAQHVHFRPELLLSL